MRKTTCKPTHCRKWYVARCVHGGGNTLNAPQAVLASDLEEACLALVHSVLFVRVIGPVAPLEGYVQTLDVCYVRRGGRCALGFGDSHGGSQAQVDDTTVRQKASDAVERFCKHISRAEARGRAVLCVRLYEQKKSTSVVSWMGLGGKTEQVLWEQWMIPFRLVSADTSSAAAAVAGDAAAPTEASVRAHTRADVLAGIDRVVAVVNDAQQYIPRLAKQDVVPFHFDIAPLGALDRAAAEPALLGFLQ